jgi:hypothetical protein
MQIFSMEAQKRCIHHCTVGRVVSSATICFENCLEICIRSGNAQLKARAGEMSLARLRVFSEKKLRVASRNALLRFDLIYIYGGQGRMGCEKPHFACVCS